MTVADGPRARHTFLVASNHPSRRRFAVHAVLFEIVRGFAAAGERITYLPILVDRDAPPLSPDETADLREATNGGLKMLDPLWVELPRPASRPFGWLARHTRVLLHTRETDLFPAVALRSAVAEHVARSGADLIANVWSPEGVAATYQLRAAKFVYYGVPDHVVAAAQLAAPELFDLPHRGPRAWLRLRALRLLNERRKRMHLAFMRDQDVVGDLGVLDAEYYARQGHARAIYIPNLYPDRGADRDERRRQLERVGRPLILAGSSHARSTGNTFGLHELARVLPELRGVFGAGGFDVDICGAGTPFSSIRTALERYPEVRLRGWVPSLDDELLRSNVYLMLNNAGHLKGTWTRIIQAWSLGACIVAHRASEDAMPEMRHMENCLLGSTPAEIARLVATAIADPPLRRRLGVAGRARYEHAFEPTKVIPRILDAMRLARLSHPGTD